jgi:hypothetical protein
MADLETEVLCGVGLGERPLQTARKLGGAKVNMENTPMARS